MKKKAIALAVALTLGMGVFGSTTSAEAAYTGQIGDTLWGLPNIFNLSLADLKELDEIDSIWVDPEQTLSIERILKEGTNDNTHLIEAGDTLFSLAKVYNVKVEDLQEWNNLSSDLILVGETLAVKETAAKPKTEKSVASTSSTPSTPSTVKKTTTKPVTTVTSAPPSQDGQTYTMRATAYTAYCEGCSGITANGTDIRSNPNLKVIAVDPRVIPLGTKVWVEGYGEAVAADTGGAIKGNKIDVFIPSDGQARNWGVRTVTVKILN
ncbi:3D domain-containing protein [Lysinibacillus sp. NPDC097279]|uniref:3D domain-containing protein n=1 Tax=Lysinibacillus sp. NPDC097279 TaxID=3364143 RepID=UPI0038124C58